MKIATAEYSLATIVNPQRYNELPTERELAAIE